VADPLVFSNDADFDADVLNLAFSTLDLRLKALEGLTIDYAAAIAQIQGVGLARLEDALRPVYDALTEIAQLGAVFTTTSATPGTLALGTMSFVIEASAWRQFAAAGYLIARSAADPSLGVSGRLQSYDRTTGTLTILVDALAGPADTPIASWSITAGVDPGALRTYLDNSVSSLRDQLVGGASAALDSFGEIEARITKLIGTATSAADTLGELQATATANASAALDQAVAMAIALG
jgi:hypothetical protein